MVLNGDVIFGIEGVFIIHEISREHQEPDIVKQRGECEVM